MSTEGFTAAGLRRLQATLDQEAEASAAPGLVALLDRGGRTEVMTSGRMAVGGPPMRRDVLFRIASMTKLVTAAAVMMLIEEGKLRLDEPVQRWLPELANRRVLKRPDGPLDDTVPANRPITVEDLLTFRCGWGTLFAPPTVPILKAVADLGVAGFGPPDPRRPYGPDEWLRRLSTLPLMAQPGDAWLYTMGSNLQGVLVARVAGQPLDVFFDERILAPLGMKDTGFWVPSAKLDRLATAYTAPGGKLTVQDDAAHTAYALLPTFLEGDSGLVSCADDLLAFSRMLLAGGTYGGERLLTAASVKAMTSNHLTPAQAEASRPILGVGRGWGYGMSVMTGLSPLALPPGVFGWSGGRGTSWYMDPAKGLTTLLLTNRLFESPDPPAAHKAFWKGAYSALS